MNKSRTWLVSVLFLDIVGYSKVPVDRQMVIKQHFVGLVANHVHNLEESECIQLDTGDGCAICYLGDPEKMYPLALELRHQFACLANATDLSYAVRLGLNLGPVKVVDGISGERNCVGAGINDAQRIMDFATENQLLVSKSYFDVVSNMSSHYIDELNPAGTHVDKHDKIHEVYALAPAALIPDQQQVSLGGLELEGTIKQRLTREYAKYVGASEAEISIQQMQSRASSINELCALLADKLSEDDRYHFNEFASYYGYI